MSLEGSIAEADFAADLAQVIVGKGNEAYLDPARFFANTYPTRGLRNLLVNVCRRLTGAGGEVAAIFRLDTSYGGGKTHGLIALDPCRPGHERRVECRGVRGSGPCCRKAPFVSQPSMGRMRTLPTVGPWAAACSPIRPGAKSAYALAGADGYARLRNSDESHIAPGAETLRELFGGEPVLIPA